MRRIEKPKAEFLPTSFPDEAKVLLWDIECTHLKPDFGTILCIGYRWLGQKQIHVPSIMDYKGWKNDPTDDSRLLQDFLKVISQADIIVTYNGAKFDVPYLKAKLLEHDLGYLPPFKHVDLYQVVRKNVLLSRRSLANVSRYLKLKAEKTPVEGREWKRAMSGNAASITYVIEHCKADVELLEEAYLKLRPLIKTHPAIKYEIGACMICGEGSLVRKKYNWTKSRGMKAVYQCRHCESWA